MVSSGYRPMPSRYRRTESLSEALAPPLRHARVNSGADLVCPPHPPFGVWHTEGPAVAVAQLVRAPGCGPGGRGFKSPRSPHCTPGRRSRVRVAHSDRASSSTAEQRTLNPQVPGSNPGGRTAKGQVRAHRTTAVTATEYRRPNTKPNNWGTVRGGRQHATNSSQGTDVWELRAYLGRDSNGRIRHRYATFHGTKREAQRALARLVADTDRHQTSTQADALPTWGERTTINDAIAAWKDNGWEDLSPTTIRRYEGLWEDHIRRAIGRRRHRRPQSVRGRALLPQPQEPSEWPKAASARSVPSYTEPAGWRRSGAAAHSPTPSPTPSCPRGPSDDKTHVQAPSVEEVRQILRAAESEDRQIAVALRVIAATGMRRGEACALRWCHIDATSGTIQVSGSIVAIQGGASVKSPKTRASIRQLALDANSLKALEELHEIQRDLADAAGVALAGTGFAFSFEPGGLLPPHPDGLSHAFTRIRIHAQLARRSSPSLSAALPRHRPRPGDQRSAEADPPGLVHRPDGPPLHRFRRRGGPAGRGAHRPASGLTTSHQPTKPFSIKSSSATVGSSPAINRSTAWQRNAQATVDPEVRQRQIAPLDRAINRGAPLAEKDAHLLHTQQQLAEAIAASPRSSPHSWSSSYQIDILSLSLRQMRRFAARSSAIVRAKMASPGEDGLARCTANNR